MLSGDVTADKIKERFRKYLFDADLFSVSKPIHNDVFSLDVEIMPGTLRINASVSLIVEYLD